MKKANAPSGPGKSIKEQRDAVTEREEIDEIAATDDAQAQRNARHAERDAHTSSTPTGRGGGRAGGGS
jgi:hypothetical protein